MLKYKSGFDWGEKIIDISNGNFSTMTLSDGNTIETVLFDNYFLVNLINKKGKVIAFIKQNL